MKSKHNVGVIVIDYLQLMTVGKDSGKGNREQEVSLISRTIKALAKELDVPIIALSQLSRQVESRTDKRPLLSDLRESGSLEQDADIVSFLYRPEYYGINENEQGESTHAYGEMLIAKNRHGKLGVAKMKFTDYLAMYSDQNTHEVDHPDTRIEPLKPNTNFVDEPPF
jgi:replicative DNA helicase